MSRKAGAGAFHHRRYRALVLAGLSASCAAVASEGTARGNLVTHLKLDESSGATAAADSSGRGHVGTLVNANAATAWVAGKAGNGLDTDGADDYLQVADGANAADYDFGTGPFSVSFWVRKQASSVGSNNFDNIWGVGKWNTGGSPGTNEWDMFLTKGDTGGTDQAEFVVESGSTTYRAFSAGSVLTPGATFHHLVGVRDGAALRLYVDGVLSATAAIPVGAAMNNIAGRNLRVANSDFNMFHTDAVFDDIQIYNEALTDGGVATGQAAGGQVAFLFNNPGVAVPEPAGLAGLVLAGSGLLSGRRRA